MITTTVFPEQIISDLEKGCPAKFMGQPFYIHYLLLYDLLRIRHILHRL